MLTKSALSGLVAILLSGTAFGADMPVKKDAPAPVAASTDGLDYAFGAKLQSDYISRGITQTNHQPGVTAYGELRYNLSDTQFYAGTQFWSVKLPTDPAAEIDLYGGVRQTWGNFAIDAGGIYYVYANNTRQFFADGTTTSLSAFPGAFPTTAKDVSFYEVYAKPTYNINDMFTVGGNLYYSPNWTNVRATETYVSGTLKVNLPNNFSVSGEFGREILGHSSLTYGPTNYVSYNTWNAGVSYTYKVATLDLRYYGTSLSKGNCYINGSDPKGNVVGGVATNRSNWCGSRAMVSLSFDLTSKDLK